MVERRPVEPKVASSSLVILAMLNFPTSNLNLAVWADLPKDMIFMHEAVYGESEKVEDIPIMYGETWEGYEAWWWGLWSNGTT